LTSLSFAEFGLAAPLNRALDGAGFVTPTPIQAQAIPHLLQGRDLLGLAQTGTGKTAAFVLPILQALRALGTKPEPLSPRALILAPTRELAIQIHETVKMLAKGQHLAHASVFGGVSINPQIDSLRRGLDVLIATPGRLVDLIQQKQCKLSSVRFFVLDEADRMLDMGFIRDIKRILALLPKERQSMLFSATMPDAIGEIASGLLKDPVTVEVRPEAVPMERIAQHLVHLPMKAKKDALLKLLSTRDVTRAMVFARTKHGANRVTDYLVEYGVEAVAIHGNKSQGARQKALAEFKSGAAKVLVATDIAARGIDIADVSHVINAELPDEPEAYVHRIGRTARAGKIGVSITLCAPEEKDKLRAVERLIKRALPVMVIPGLDLAAAQAGGERISDEREERGGRRGRGAPRAERPHVGRRGEERRFEERGRAPRADQAAPSPQRPAPRREDARRDDARRDDRRFDDRPAVEAKRDARPPRAPHDARPPRAHHEAAHAPRAGQPVRPGDASAFRDAPRQPRPEQPARGDRPQGGERPARGERPDFMPRFLDNGGARPAPRGRRRAG
jgi:ATP-dependent RNA helicase RhlE